MSETVPSETQTTLNNSLKDKIYLQNTNAVIWTLLAVLFGAVLYMGAEVIQMPFVAVGFFPLGFAPALALVATVGAIRGPLAGFLVGYFGEQLASIYLSGGIVAFSLYGVAFGVLGLIAGLPRYDFTSGRSLAKLSILSAIGLIFAALIVTIIGLYVEHVAVLVAIGLQLLPLLTIGIPTVILLTPLFVRFFWSIASVKIPWSR